MLRSHKTYSLLTLLLLLGFMGKAQTKIGLAKVKITPEVPMWMTGFAARTVPSTGTLQDIWAKAMVVQEHGEVKLALITTDILGLSRQVEEAVAAKVLEKYQIPRERLVMNSSHTHSGPMVWPALGGIADYTYADQKKVSAYQDKLADSLVKAVGNAIGKLTPAVLSTGHGQVDFAINRRNIKDGKVIHGVNKDGIGDHDVPVIRISTPEGKTLGVIFGYACHNTTIQGDNTLINGDYAGFAQSEVEKALPGTIAMFMMGCAGDQNPFPRGKVELAQQHGQTLAKEVTRVLSSTLKPVPEAVKTAFTKIDLTLQPKTVEAYQTDILKGDAFVQRRAKLMLEAYNKGWPIDHYSYPIQAIGFGNTFFIAALAGEPVVEYSLKLKKRFAKKDLFVSGYNNEVMCYIPSARVLQEGGYEADDNMIYYQMAGPFKPELEDKILKATTDLLKKVGAGN
jgi:neutral ceramidase